MKTPQGPFHVEDGVVDDGHFACYVCNENGPIACVSGWSGNSLTEDVIRATAERIARVLNEEERR